MPRSAREAWDLDTGKQEMLSGFLDSCPLFLGVLQEYALAVVPKPGFSEGYCAGVQEGGRNLIEKILNMTKERVTHNKGAMLQRKSGQVGAGLPSDKQLRPPAPPPFESRRLSGPIPPKTDVPEPPDPT